MVHALKKAANFLSPGGVILEVHDLLDPPRIEVHSNGNEFYAGQLYSQNDFENQRQADQAIIQAVQTGFLISDTSKIFEYFIRADAFASLTDWLEEDWESAYIPESTRHKIVDLVAQSGEGSEVVLRMGSRIMRLKPTPEIT